ncbi:BMP family ABC transporter substrate-binding protein [Bacillus solitudinis]|uniref:BMP family ABC transporter substrate-binding protein n=1 Tax=Bacillus solitudinis TaxID=2014074 RepID=UPI000C249EB4|nr:BMP family ABC transporter substrate-binding protein [Bacillus solitudinis]
MQESKQVKIIVSVTLIIAIALICIVGLKVSGILHDSKTSVQADKVKVTIITSDVISDQSWGSLAYKGQLKIEEQFQVDVTLYSEIATEELMKETVEKAVKEETDLIIGQGREFSNVFTQLANSHTNIHFVTIHGTSKYSNQSVYTFEQGEIEHFAALAAALKTRTKKVAVLDAIESREKNPEFENALAYYIPEATFYYKVVNSRDDSKKAIQLATELFKEGVDVIYTKGNAYNLHVIELAKQYGIYVIGYLDDQSYIAKDHVLTSVTNDVSQMYVAIMRDYLSEHGIKKGKVMLKESDGIYQLAPFGPMFTDREKEMINIEIEKFQNGELRF